MTRSSCSGSVVVSKFSELLVAHMSLGVLYSCGVNVYTLSEDEDVCGVLEGL